MPNSSASATRHDRLRFSRVEIGGKAEGRSVGDRDCFLLGFEAEQRRNGPERLFRRQEHFGRRVAKQNGTGVLLAFRHRIALRNDPCAFLQGIRDMPLDLLDGRAVDHRPNDDALLRTGANLHLRNSAGELCGKRLIDAGLHENAVGTDAGLAAIAKFRVYRPFDGEIEICVIEDDERRVPAELEAEPFDAVGGALHQQRADAGRTGEGDLAHRFVGHQLFADLSPACR